MSRCHFAALFLCAVTTVARAVSPPVIGGVPDRVIVLNTNTGTLYFEIGDPASATLSVAASSGNTAPVPGDGTHPADTGRTKVANLLLNFLKTDATAKSWFTGKSSRAGAQ